LQPSHKRFKELINVSGTMTALGSSSVSPEVIAQMDEVLPKFVDMVKLQKEASKVISRVIGAQAGCVTACAASCIAIGVAACMTGSDMAKVEQLPDTVGMKNEVIMQRGHEVWFGGSVPQTARLPGAKVVEIGDATRAGGYQLEGAINENTAAALYVVSHHTVQYGLIGLEDFCEVAHAHGVPVIVDAASESNISSFFEQGADLACLSGHKFLAGPTSGIVAGCKELVEACLFHQYHGIGRAMKVGKEGIIGAMAALERWENLDHNSEQQGQEQIVGRLLDNLKNIPGLLVYAEPDPTGNPIRRVTIKVDPKIVGLSAFEISMTLRESSPPIVVRDHEAIDQEYFQLDPCNIQPEQADFVTREIRRIANLSDEDKKRLRATLPQRPNDADLLVESLKGWIAQ
jgi:D-glucosaminate-6-phosphate ammonia-lyase